MSDTIELKTVQKCMPLLELALKTPERPLVFFLETEGFIGQECCDEVLSPRSTWSVVEKAGELVKRIRDRISEDSTSYQKLLKYLRSKEALYAPIVKRLDEEYSEQERKGTYSLCMSCTYAYCISKPLQPLCSRWP